MFSLDSSEVITKVPNWQRVIHILASLGINTEDKVWFTEKHNTVSTSVFYTTCVNNRLTYFFVPGLTPPDKTPAYAEGVK